MAKLMAIRTDNEKELNGVWIPYELGIQVKIARAGNTKYQAYLQELCAPYRTSIRQTIQDAEILQEVTRKATAKCILLDWKNIEDEEGNPLSYSPEKALELFSDPELKDFYEFILTVSQGKEEFRKEVIEDSEKN